MPLIIKASYFPMLFLFLGPDIAFKDSKIAETKKKYLLSSEALHFDFDQWDGHKLEAAELKKSLIALPGVSDKRLVLIRNIEKLSAQNKELILDCLQNKPQHLVLLLDSNEADTRNAFIAKLSPQSKIFSTQTKPRQNVFDMTRAMSSRNSVEALRILDELMEEGDHPLQIMGGLVWFWGKTRGRIPSERFQKGLQYLQEADLNIKRSRLKPEHAVEVLVAKLGRLI